MLILTTKELAIVKEILKRHVPKRTVWAFGSRAKGTTKKTADLDLTVIGKKPLSENQRIGLTRDFEESSLPFRVDVVDWATTTPEFRQIISKDKVVISK